MDDIDKLRRAIDAVDDELLALINRRAALASRIGAFKAGAPAYRPERETEILRRVADNNPGPLAAERVTAAFREVISACRGREEAFRRCEAGAVQFTVVPVENSTEGVVGRTLDLLLATPLRICAEVELRVQQNLLAKGALKDVRRIYSHAQSLAQCDAWLAHHLAGAERIPVASNAEAAQRAAQEPGAAAIAGEAAAERYGLQVLAKSIEDAPNNTTRFLVLGELDTAPTGKDRTSLVMSAENKPGAVHALLTPLAEHKVSRTRIESRPARSRSALWEYMFFIDLEGHQKDAPVAAALTQLGAKAPFLKVLGSYPIAK